MMSLKSVFVFAIFALCLSQVYSNPADDVLVDPYQDGPTITLDDFLTSRFSARGYGGSWISDTELQTTSGGNFYVLDIITNTFTNRTYQEDITEYLDGRILAHVSLSPDGRYLLVTHSRKKLPIHYMSYSAKYAVYNIQSRVFTELQPTPGGDQPDLQLVRWAPTGNSLAFVFGNNIYYKSSAQDTTDSVRITLDGSADIYNGITDWVYEEEMFFTSNALWFSPDSNYLAFVKFNDALVKDFSFPMYGEPGDKDHAYPEQITIKYPKAGETNPVWTLMVSNLNSNPENPQAVTYPGVSDPARRHYVGSVQWADSTDLLLITLNRAQTDSTTFRCPGTTRVCTPILTESEPHGWIDVYTPRISTKDPRQFLILRYASTGRQHIFQHTGNNNTIGQISNGAIHVSSIIAWNEDTGIVYFSGTRTTADGQGDASQTQIYRVDDNVATDDAPVCITCDDVFLIGGNPPCLSNSFSFSKNFTFVTHSCEGPIIPYTVIRKTSDWSVVKTMENNEALRANLALKEVPQTRDLKVPVAGGFTANVRLILPTNFDENAKYPLLIQVYGGPGFQLIGQGFGVTWGTSLVSDKKIIYGLIDGRGSGRQTKDLLFQLNRVLGTVEIEDQIAVTKNLITNHAYIDATKTAIWGGSYGGYATAMAMSKDTEGVFKCGISVSPVTNWLYYDTIYTEKYMKMPTPTDNWNNYNASDVTTHVENFRTKKFFLVHGNADDNVHYQQAMVLSRALEQNDIMFRQLSYPDESHGINGMRRHMYHSLQDFLFMDCFADTQKVSSSSNYIKPSMAFLISIWTAMKIMTSLSF